MEKKRSNQALLEEMRKIAKQHEDMKATVDGMLKEIEILEVKHQMLAEEIKENTKR